MIDRFDRKHTYLRLAVTDRCNLRCRYCMPAEGIQFSPKEELLRYEEMLRLTQLLRHNGLTKVRLTGGEPLARRGIEVLMQGLLDQGLRVHITTNAVLLDKFMVPKGPLYPLSGSNISLASVNHERIGQSTRREGFA
ncbi:MAG: radical SAM protein [Bacteroidota bacterium]